MRHIDLTLTQVATYSPDLTGESFTLYEDGTLYDQDGRLADEFFFDTEETSLEEIAGEFNSPIMDEFGQTA